MSYCRWSSDDFRCDLYCYEDVSGGYTTHVAASRYVGDIPSVPSILSMPLAEWEPKYRAQQAAIEAADIAPIGLPFDGETFNDPDLESFLARLIELREVGYQFPDYVLRAVREELAAVSPPRTS